MIQDALLQLSAAQAVTATAVSTNVIDLSTASDIGKGANLNIDVRVNQAATSVGGSATVIIQVVTDDDGAGTNQTIISQTDALPQAALKVGASIPIRIQRAGTQAVRRYLYIKYVVAGGPLTAGQFTAGVVIDEQDPQVSYPSGFSVK